MKKLISIVLIVLILSLASCANGAGKKKIDYSNDKNLKKYSNDIFELYHPKSWTTVQSESGYATVYSFDSLQLISFGRAPEEGSGKRVLSFQDTYEKFRGGFLSKGSSVVVETSNGIDVEVIQFSDYVNNFVFKTSVSEGTIALWNDGKTSYALIDVADMHQAEGGFAAIYDSFKYLN